MRQRWQAAAVAYAPYAFHQFGLLALDRGRCVVRQIAVESFLVGLHVALAQQHLGEVRPAGKMLSEHLYFFEGDIDAERVQLGDQLTIALAAALLMAADPVAELRCGRRLQKVAEQVYRGWTRAVRRR